MRNTYLLLLGLSFSAAFGQGQLINLNNIYCNVSANGSLFQNENAWALCNIKDASFNSVMFTGHLWLAAIENNNLYTATQDYYLAQDLNYGASDFHFGPVANDQNLSAYVNRYNRVWKMDRSMIDQHIQNYNDPNYQILNEILEWPAHGDTSNGEAWLLAPFADLNANQEYEPLLGEYPIIRGDQTIYCIFNESDRHQPRTNLSDMGFEVHLQVYAYDTTSLAALNNALFFNYRIINRSNFNYESVYASQWYDSDLGYSFDDICGSDSSLALSYTYNADSIDGPGVGFGANPPAVGFSLLNANAGGAMYYNNSGGFNGPIATTDPSLPVHWKNLMQNRWRDGSHLSLENPSGLFNLANGDGFDTSQAATASNWAYNDQDNWYCSPLNTGDKRQMLNVSPQALAAGDTLCIDLLLSYARDLNDGNPFAAVDKMKNEVGALQAFWQNRNFTCSENFVNLKETASSLQNEVYPNPFVDELNISWNSLHKGIFKLYNAQGSLMMEGAINSPNASFSLKSLEAGVYLLYLQEKGSSNSQCIRLLKK